MIEAVFRISALVESNNQGQSVFKISEQGEPANDAEFASIVTRMYQQDVYRTLRAGDTLTITFHLDLPIRVIERTVRFREDQQFAGEGLQEPTPDLLSMLSMMYKQFRQQVCPGDVFTVTFDVQRP